MAREAIFIGYRRDDTADVAGRIYDALTTRFGKGRVFKDVDSLRPGANFGQYIKGVLPNCRAALVLIGPAWTRIHDDEGRRRLDDPNDWVRLEVETALNTPGLDVVPVLVNGAVMPREEELPRGLRPLLQLHAAVIRRDPDFHDDVARLAAALRASVQTGLLDLGALGGAERPSAHRGRSGSRAALLTAGVIAAAVGAAAIWQPWRPVLHAPPSTPLDTSQPASDPQGPPPTTQSSETTAASQSGLATTTTTGVGQRRASDAQIAAVLESVSANLGRAHYIRVLCAGQGDQTWRDYQRRLLDLSPEYRDRLVRSFNDAYLEQQVRVPECNASAVAAEATFRAPLARAATSLKDIYMGGGAGDADRVTFFTALKTAAQPEAAVTP